MSLITHLGFSYCDPDYLASHKGEQSLHHGVHYSEELAKPALHQIRFESFVAVLPIGEANARLTWDTPQIDDEGQEYQSSEGYDLD